MIKKNNDFNVFTESQNFFSLKPHFPQNVCQDINRKTVSMKKRKIPAKTELSHAADTNY